MQLAFQTSRDLDKPCGAGGWKREITESEYCVRVSEIDGGNNNSKSTNRKQLGDVAPHSKTHPPEARARKQRQASFRGAKGDTTKQRQKQRHTEVCRLLSPTGTETIPMNTFRKPHAMCIVIAIFLFQGTSQCSGQQTNKRLSFTKDQASKLAAIALIGIQKEFPNKPGHVFNKKEDAKIPREFHPAFYGCYDWHSAVHSHWMLIRLLKTFPELDNAEKIRAVLRRHLAKKNLKTEADYFRRPNTKSFERTYGWAWLLKLVEELHSWKDKDGNRWRKNIKPLEKVIVDGYLQFLPKQTYPIRTGVHPNTAFGLAFALDYARAVEHKKLIKLIEERSRTYYGKDENIPASWEPGGNDFFSPSLIEADLMWRVLSKKEYSKWLGKFLPGLAKGKPKTLFEPATVSDRRDPLIVHLDGLNLSRAWCMRNIAAALGKNHPAYPVLIRSATRHGTTALKHVASGEYAGEHWLASFAVYMLSTPNE